MDGPAPLDLDFTEDPVDVPNPDRGAYRGRWQWVDTRFGALRHRGRVRQRIARHGWIEVNPSFRDSMDGA